VKPCGQVVEEGFAARVESLGKGGWSIAGGIAVGFGDHEKRNMERNLTSVLDDRVAEDSVARIKALLVPFGLSDGVEQSDLEETQRLLEWYAWICCMCAIGWVSRHAVKMGVWKRNGERT
jgi:hypothetical protein